MNHEDFDADAEEPHSSTPRLPLINPGYDTPDSDYNYEVAKHQNKASHEEKENLIAVLHEPEPLTDASSVIASSESGDSYGKASQLTGSIKKSGDYISYGHNERAPRKASVPKVKYNDKYSGSYADSEISESQVSSKSYKSSGLNDSQHSVKDNKTKPQRSVRLQSTPENKRVSIRETQRKEVRRTSKAGQSLSSPVKRCDKHDNVIRSCTYADGFGSNKTALSFPMVEQNKRESKSANELGLVFDQCLSTPAVSLRGSAKSKGDRTEEYYSLGSPCKLSLVDSCSVTRRSTPDKRNKHKNAWSAARMSPRLYQDIKERLLKEGKFKEELRKYWGLDIQEKINRPDSDDDGYDTDLETNLGLELIADEKSREVIEDGIYPEYKQNCRRFKSTPNSYFMRYSLEDSLRMRYRYLNKGDSIAMSTQMKNHLTMSDIDLKDNAIGADGMNFFKHMLKENKRLTELNLASNNLGPEGARYLKHALRSNCFLLKLNVANNNFGEKGSRHCAALLEENVSLQEVNMSGNAIGDYGAMLISKALEENVCLKLVDLSWNYIGRRGGVKLCDCLKKNTELEIFRAHTNGFGDEGGKMLINSLKVNHVLKEVDLSNNRLTDAFIKTLTFNLNEMQGITVLKIARNNFLPKPIFDFLAAIMTAETAITHIDIEGIHITEEFKGIANAVKVVQDVSVVYDDPPSKREYATDILHRNLVVLCEFLEAQELEVEDLYPDYEEIEEEGGDIPMVTVGEVISCLEQSGKVTRQDKIQRLKSKLKLSSKRRFHISELAVVYDGVICGKDVLRDKPLRSHLRKSIREERAEKERLAKRRTRASQIPSRVAKTAEPPSEDI